MKSITAAGTIALCAIAGTAGLGQTSWPKSPIAYVAPSRESQHIRVIGADGSGARTIWTAPAGTAADDGPGTLAWRPDGRAITFDSSHDYARSTLARDLYTVAVTGGPIIRPTSMPDSSAVSSMPQGGVRVHIRNAGFQGRELMVYVEGATEPVRVTAAQGAETAVTVPRVADFGAGVRQYVRVLDTSPQTSHPCWMDVAAFADVTPGTTVDAGVLSTLNGVTCAFAFAPSWRADGRSIVMLFREATRSLAALNDVWRIEPAPKPGPAGDRVLDASSVGSSSDRFYIITMSPARTSADQVLLARNGALDTPIFLSSDTDVAGRLEAIDLGRCPRTTCTVTGVAWQPSGTGFFISRVETGAALGSAPAAGGAIYAYDLASRKASPVLRLPNEVIGRLSTSPDGERIVFERAARLDPSPNRVIVGPRAMCPCDLWLVDRDGKAPRVLVKDGRAPAWSP